jgi:ADP-ribosylglycohydrolase
MNLTDITSRAQGCFLGLACGDALGDLGRSDEFRKRYGIITNLYQDAKSTDDTEFAVLTARILLDCQGQLSSQAMLAGWRRYILEQGGVGARGGQPLYGSVQNLLRGLEPPLSGRYNVGNIDDGAAMRAAPHGILYPGQPERAAESAELDAQMSHANDGIWAARAVAASISSGMAGASHEEMLAAGLSQIPAGSWLGYCMDKAMALCEQASHIQDVWEALHSEFWTPSHAAAPEALPQIYAISRLTKGDFKQGMFWAGNFGRDADTIGAVVGAFSGALNGLSVIPADWISRVRRPSGVCLKFAAQEDLLDLAAQLAGLAARLG